MTFMITYPHKYEVVIYRTSYRTGRPLVSLTVHSGDDREVAHAVYLRRRASNNRYNTARFHERTTTAEYWAARRATA